MPYLLKSQKEEFEFLSKYIFQKAHTDRPLNILEAGCGNESLFDLEGIEHELTGVDANEIALDNRKNHTKDLHNTILGDLRTIVLKENKYDVVYNSFVLEHISGAELVLKNFINWLKPGGILILRIPDRDSVFGFVTRMTPFWFHVFVAKYIFGHPNAGRPGYGPFKTVYDKIVSRRGINKFCKQHKLNIKAEYYSNYYIDYLGAFSLPIRVIIKLIHLISLRRLDSDHNTITYVIEKT